MFLSYVALLLFTLIKKSFCEDDFSTRKLSIMQFINTVHSEIFARVLFSRSFAKMKPSRNGEITLSFIDVGKSCPSRAF